MKTLPLFAAALFAASTASAAQIWVAPAAQKIQPTVQIPTGAVTSAQLAAAQNEFESFHVVVSGQAAGVTMALEGLSDGKGHVISGRDVVLYREALLYVPAPSGGDGAIGYWPDALVPDVDPVAGEKRNAFPFDVPVGESRAVLVDIHAPQGTPAGVYAGVVNVSGGVTAQVPVQLTVWDFAIPSTSTLRSAFGMQWNGPCLGHGDPNCSGGAADSALRARYVQAALDNHVSIQQPYFTAPINADGSGNFSGFDQYVAPFLDGTANTRLPGAKLSAISIDGASNAAVSAAWAQHFRQKGWFPSLFAYTCDEPPLTCQWTDVSARDAAVHAGDAQLPTLVTTTTWDAQKNGGAGIDLYVPVINFVEGKPGTVLAGSQRSRFPATTWWYQSCMSFGCAGVGGGLDGKGETGWPTMAIDSDGTRNRAMEWLSFSYDMQGELYYETTNAFGRGDPWVNQSAFGGTGDGTLFYPGTPAKIGGQTEIPVESLRLKGIRDGMEDYELLALAQKLGLGAQALAIAQGVFPKTYLATSSAAAIDSARAELAALILHALGKDQPAPPPAGSAGSSPSGAPGTTCATTGCTAAAPAAVTQTPRKTGLASIGYPTGGCSSTGAQSLWLALPLFGAFALRRRRALSKVRRR